MTARAAFDGPLGRLVLTEEAGAITRLSFGGEAEGAASPLLNEAGRQLDAYLSGRLRGFDLPLAIGEGARARFLEALLAIPYGETRSYGELARDLGVSAQAIGQACGANPIPIIIPCHRVLGADGLGGFSAPGGIETKIALLKLEGAAGLLI
ncbi:methylated-DNA--[protein]-cysteine S-methyltransferase [Ostreiculturibacter nitratireducens]|uniref:methylated-DNA--[protein]-cysteine S-methyltransferase n=1 Tax=Ostreiculturibacter nitratireducens TaxID=3075226 RepID=UPI0031B5D41C